MHIFHYTWYQWLSFFYIYCFAGWIFESAYVSIRQKRLVNRGFLRLPLLPLYGTGAVMMLWVSLPFRDSLFLVYLSGVIAATILEYVTGWTMERLFKMKYWDYSNQKFNLNGYICLSSSIAWGFLTIFLTEILHPPVSELVLALPAGAVIAGTAMISVLFAADTVQSVRDALDLGRALEALTNARAELDDIQVQLALLRAETADRLNEYREDAADRLNEYKAGAADRLSEYRAGAADRLSEYRAGAADLLNEYKAGAADRLSEYKAGAADLLSSSRDEAAGRISGYWEDAARKLNECREETALQMERLKTRAMQKVGQAQSSGSDRISALLSRGQEILEKHSAFAGRLNRRRRNMLLRNPTAASGRFGDALKELYELAKKQDHGNRG